MTDVINEHESVENAINHLKEQTAEIPDNKPDEETDEENEVDEDEETGEYDQEYIDTATDVALDIINITQETVFKIVANNKRKKRIIKIDPDNGITRLKELRAQRAAGTSNKSVEVITEYTGKDAALLQCDAVFDEFIKGLPFTEKQRDMMRPGLKYMVKKNAGRIPPELLFYSSLATAIGGNIAELLTL